MTEPLYRGEARLLSWGENNSSGRYIRLEIEAEGTHQFRGHEGERFAVVIVGPLASTDHGQKEQIAGRKPGKAGGTSTREGEGSGHTLSLTPPASSNGRTSAFEAENGGSTPPAGTKPKQHWEDMRPSARAAMRLKEPEFWRYIREVYGSRIVLSESMADEWLKRFLGLEKSKSEMDDTTTFYGENFDALDGKFKAWMQAKGHGVI